MLHGLRRGSEPIPHWPKYVPPRMQLVSAPPPRQSLPWPMAVIVLLFSQLCRQVLPLAKDDQLSRPRGPVPPLAFHSPNSVTADQVLRPILGTQRLMCEVITALSPLSPKAHKPLLFSACQNVVGGHQMCTSLREGCPLQCLSPMFRGSAAVVKGWPLCHQSRSSKKQTLRGD